MSDLSFSVRVKAEISRNKIRSLSERQAVIAGVFCAAAGLENTPALAVKLTKESATHIADLLSREGITHLVRAGKVTVLPESAEKLKGLIAPVFEPGSEDILSSDRAFSASFLKGAFLSRGYCGDPARSYRIEIHAANPRIVTVLTVMLHSFDIIPAVLKREKYNVIYFKKGDQVSDFLTITGANHHMMEFENQRVEHQVTGNVTRIVNCDSGNSARQSNASAVRYTLIKKLMESPEAGKLPPELKEAAEVSLTNPGASIAELGKLMDPPIGKSGMNHRLMKLTDLANNLD